MIKIVKDKNLSDSSFASFENPALDQQKTTNINVLLNRVRLNKKNIFRKKVIFTILLTLTVSTWIFLSIF